MTDRTLEDLNVGDYVVHVQHGIAKYRGLKRLSVQGFDSDYLILEFAGGDTLYVPLERLDQVQRGAGVGAETEDVPRIRRNFRLVQNHVKHTGRVRGDDEWPASIRSSNRRSGS
mgnify:CR=1 FL=1